MAGGVFGGFELMIRTQPEGTITRLVCLECAQIAWSDYTITEEKRYSLDNLLSEAAIHNIREHFRGEIVSENS